MEELCTFLLLSHAIIIAKVCETFVNFERIFLYEPCSSVTHYYTGEDEGRIIVLLTTLVKMNIKL